MSTALDKSFLIILGLCLRFSFVKLLFWDRTEGEGMGEDRWILLSGRDAILDGFFYHLWGPKIYYILFS